MVFKHRDRIREIAASRNAEAVTLFGSTARGEDTADSDIDFILDLNSEASLFDMAAIKMDLESLLGCPVDVVSRRSVPDGAESVGRDSIPV